MIAAGRKCNAVGARIRIESIRKGVIIDGILKTVRAVVIKRAGPSAPWRSPLNVRDYIWPRRLVGALLSLPAERGTAAAPLSFLRNLRCEPPLSRRFQRDLKEAKFDRTIGKREAGRIWREMETVGIFFLININRNSLKIININSRLNQ